GAARVELRLLLEATRQRWTAQGRVLDEAVDVVAAARRHDLVIDCTGASGAAGTVFDFVPWEFSKGEALEIAVDGLAPDVVIHRRHAIVPLAPGRAWVGATHEPGVTDVAPTPLARATLEASGRALLAHGFDIVAHRDRKSTRLNSSHSQISYAVFC